MESEHTPLLSDEQLSAICEAHPYHAQLYAKRTAIAVDAIHEAERTKNLARISDLESEGVEQSRLLGASGSREAALLARIAELEEERRWIPVEERLPEEDRTVLIACVRGYVGPGHVDAGDWLLHGIGEPDNEEDPVTHWKPLPTPPTK